MNVGSLFTRHAWYRTHHPAFVFQEQRLTYAELNRSINRLANSLLGLGVTKGDKVVTLLPNSLELYEAYWACGKIGAVIVPMSTLLMEQALKNLISDSDAVALITSSQFMDRIDAIRPELTNIPDNRFLLTDREDAPGFASYHGLKREAGDGEPDALEVSGEDPFNIMYSSGTTGMPKGIVHTHFIRSMYGLCFASSFRMTPESVTLHAGAIVFNGAFVDLMPTVFQGATYILLPQFDPVEYIDTIARERVTHVMMVPAQIIAMLNAPNFAPEKLESLEMILTLGAPLHRKHKDELNRLLPGRFYELYGVTEGFVTVLDREDVAAKPDSVGVPPQFFQMKILDEQNREADPYTVGEICGSGPIRMKEYYKRPDLTAQTVVDGMVHTGDLGYVDNDGYLYLVDRKKDMIISGGVNVYPRDIEEVAIQHPAVNEVAVFGVPHDKWGESPVAAVVLNQTAQETAEEIRDWINTRVEAKFQRVSDCPSAPTAFSASSLSASSCSASFWTGWRSRSLSSPSSPPSWPRSIFPSKGTVWWTIPRSSGSLCSWR